MMNISTTMSRQPSSDIMEGGELVFEMGDRMTVLWKNRQPQTVVHRGRMAVTLLSPSALLLRVYAADWARPEMLLTTAEDMHLASVGAYGCPMAETTPNVARLAVEGFRFGYAYVLVSLCTPSRQVMFRAIKDSSR